MSNPARGIHRRLPIKLTDALVRRFWSRVEKGAPEECWNWNASMRNNYGAIKHQGQVLSAHRLSYVIANGEPGEGLVVGHRCDNRACCNPAHLEAITPRKNNQDACVRVEFHRNLGEDAPNAVLTDDRVRQIRRRVKAGESCRSIATEFGCSTATIWRAASGKNWKHVTSEPNE